MINVNMSSNLQGVQGWDQLAGMVKAGESDAVGGTSVNIAKNEIVVAVNDGKSTQSISISVPDLGSVDSAPDAEALREIADKIVAVANSLAAAGSIGADGTAGPELKAAISRLQGAVTASVGSSSPGPTMNSTNTSKALFDLYALMALMVEVAQKERDTSREIRLTENQQVQNSIKQQADDMRSAAAISLAFGIVTSVISGAMSVASMVGQSKAFSQQSAATEQMQTPTQNLKTAELALSPNAAEVNLQKVSQSTPEAIRQKVDGDFGAAKADFERDITAADTRLHEAETAQDHAADELTATKNKQPPASQEELQAKTDAYDKASRDVMEAKANRASIEKGFFDKLDTRLKANEVEIKAKSADPANAQEVTALKQENEYLRAYTAKAKADHASDATKTRDMTVAQNQYDRAKQEMQLDKRFAGSQQMMNRWMGIQQLTMSLSQMGNAAGNMIGEMVRAQATMEGVEQTQHNEQLDQIKDLFQQAETVVQAVVQLMQAVLAAENESIMEAIRA